MLHLQHNIVSKLYSIKGLIEAHLNRAEEKRFKDQAEALEHAQNIMKRIYDQSNRVLLITKRVSLAMKTEKNPEESISEVSIKEVWKEAIGILKQQYSFEILEVIERISNQYPLIACHRKDLLEIFYTLTQNAIQAMRQRGEPASACASAGKPAGKLIIRANLQFSAGEHPIAIITISDTGPGIPEETLPRLFEPFFTTKPLEEGNGLGLCLVKSLVKRNGGRVSVSSFKGSGTTFSLEFPVGRRKGTPSKSARSDL